MSRSFGRWVTVAAAAVWAAAAAAALSAQAPARSVNDGVYTEAQAERGAKTFDTICTACHDTGRFTGPEFLSAWTGKPLAGLFDAVNTMPEDNPGSLKAQEYADVLAYFLQLNGYPTGAEELKGAPEAMAAISVDPKP